MAVRRLRAVGPKNTYGVEIEKKEPTNYCKLLMSSLSLPLPFFFPVISFDGLICGCSWTASWYQVSRYTRPMAEVHIGKIGWSLVVACSRNILACLSWTTQRHSLIPFFFIVCNQMLSSGKPLLCWLTNRQYSFWKFYVDNLLEETLIYWQLNVIWLITARDCLLIFPR